MKVNPEILFGRGKQTRIVATETPRGEEDKIHIYYREDGEIKQRYEKYKFFILLNENDSIFKEFYDTTDVEELLGDNFYNRRVWTDNYGFIRFIEKEADDAYSPFLQSQWMLQTQECQFKDMTYNDYVAFYADLETFTKKGFNFSNASREEDKIIAIATKTNDGRSVTLALNDDGKTPEIEGVRLYESEEDLLRAFIKLFNEVDPDVFINHNIYNFDLEYFRTRCDMHGIKMALGRDGSTPNHFATSIKFAGRTKAYECYKIYGRHVIDTQFLAMQYDVYARELPNYRLKDVAKFLDDKYGTGIVTEDRTYIDGGLLSDVWRGEHPFFTREDLLKYADEDVIEAEGLYEFFSPAIFGSTQFIPMPYQDVFRYGSGNKLEYLLFREYMYNDVSWSKPEEPRDFDGGYADLFTVGVVDEPQVYVDVSSLYPWSMLTQKIRPPQDILNLFNDMVWLTRELRYDRKYKIPDATGAKKQKLKAEDASLKIILNSWYGYLGYRFGSMNYYEGADKTTALGRKVMKDMIDCAQRLGSTVVKVDTDGMLCTVPKSYQWGEKKGELDFITAIENLLKNDSVDLDHDGRYAGTMIVDKKSYVLKKYDGTMDYKGNTLTGRDNQPFTLKFLKTAIDFVFKNDYIKIKEEYDHWVNMIESGLINAHELRSRKNLNMTIEDYTQKVESGNNPITQYELARKAERNYTKGDAIEYYISSPPMILREHKTVPDKLVPKKMANYEKAKLLPEYDSDPDVKYYKKRLDKTATKLIIVLGEDRFKEIFPNISINKREREKLEIRNKMMS